MEVNAMVVTDAIHGIAAQLVPFTETGPAATLRILAVVDGSECAGRVVKCVIDLYVGRQPIEVVLVNIQPMPQEWRLRGYGWFARDAIRDRLVNDLGRRVIASAARHLDAAGVSHKGRVEIGERGETIARCAREERCGLIVLAEPRRGALRRWLARTAHLSVGSVIAELIDRLRVPVVVAP
jgi:nucleotide-binding universal stress UspA family protein